MLNDVVVWMLFPWHLTINQNIRFICPADVGYSHLREFMQKLLQTPLQLQVHSTQQWISSKNINHDFPRGTKLSSVMHRNFGGKSSLNSICLDTTISCFRPHQITKESRQNQAISGIFYWSENFQTWSKNASFSSVLLDHSSEGRFRRKQKRRNKTLLGWAVVWYLDYVAKEFILVITNAQEMGVRRAVKRRSWKNNVTRNFCPMRQGTLTQP